MKLKLKKIFCTLLALLFFCVNFLPLSKVQAAVKEKTIVLRVSSWEEYIDLGGWEQSIKLGNGTEISSQKALYEDFEDWYYKEYGKKVKVEYSTAGTNEELYNLLTMGDTYDLICPSEYMIMKLMTENRLCPYSDSFFDVNEKNNYYARGAAPFISEIMKSNQINGESWSKYAACYMWGVTGILYNRDILTPEEAGTWKIYENPKVTKQITIKDNVRDTYFTALGIMKADKLMDTAFINQSNYKKNLSEEMNDVSLETIQSAENMLSDLVKRMYSIETDSGRADLLSGKIAANYQWSGDAAYSIAQAGDEGNLKFAVPKECTNMWFDGWAMLKDGINGDSEKQHAAEAFVNFISRPDNVVRNMEYVGYTSAISGGQYDDTIYEYIKYCYGAEEEEAQTDYYSLGYFFSGDETDSDYILKARHKDTDGGELFAKYPSQDIINRSVVMAYFDADTNSRINEMWIHIRCRDIRDIPAVWWLILACGIGILAFIFVIKKNKQ